MGILEIVLAVVAWRRGWGVRALLPLVGALAVGFMAGGVVRDSGGSVSEIRGLAFLADVAAVIALGAMTLYRPRPARIDPTVPRRVAQSMGPSAE